MKMCYICGRCSKIQEFVFKDNKCVLKKICINPRCKTYNPYILHIDRNSIKW